MKKMYIKRTISLLLVLLLMFPVIGLASSGGSIISKVYFRDEAGNMVFADYEAAINQSFEGDNTLYNGIVHYVGIAEARGRAIYLETSSGKVLDYKLAMIDNLFRLEDIIGKAKYEVDHEIEYSHELRIVDGEPVIAPKTVHTHYRININGPVELEVGQVGNFNIRAFGDGKGNVNYRAKYEYAVSGGEGRLEYLDGNTWRQIPLTGFFGPASEFEITPNWDLTTNLRFIPSDNGTYTLDLRLIDLDNNVVLANARHTLTVTGETEDFPAAVEEVIVGKSPITNKTYANIEIKEEYVSVVEAVYVYNRLAYQMEDKPSQWRAEVPDGTKAEDLIGKVRVVLEEQGGEDPVEEPRVIATYHQSFLPKFGYISIQVENLPAAAKFKVIYHLSDDDDGSQNIEETTIVNIGEEAGLVFYDPAQYDTIVIQVFDANENLLHTFEGVVPVI